MSEKDGLIGLRNALRIFSAERNWDQFHSPKNLAMALSVEAAEVVEHFQWLTEEASRQLPETVRREVSFELADVMLYLVRLADNLEVDLIQVAYEKMQRNAQNYPVDKAYGRSHKYDKL